MSLTLTTHDTGFDSPDEATIARVLASLDGARNMLATLARSEGTYLQASGSAARGFGLSYQDGSLDQHFRTTSDALPLGLITEVFQKYAREDFSWRQGFEWVQERFEVPRPSWTGNWLVFVVLLLVVAALVWWFRG